MHGYNVCRLTEKVEQMLKQKRKKKKEEEMIDIGKESDRALLWFLGLGIEP